MKRKLHSQDQVRLLFEQIALNFEEDSAPSVNLDNCLLSLIDIQKSYEGRDYIEQLQNTTVLLNEFVSLTTMCIASYLCGEQGFTRVFQNSEVLSLVQTIITPQARDSEICQLNYIRNGCNGCEYHYRHECYEKIRSIRNSSNLLDYRLDLEFSIVYSQYHYLLVRYFLQNILTNKNLSGITSHITPSTIAEILDQSINNHVGLGLNLVFFPIRFTPKGEIIKLSQSEVDEMLEAHQRKTWKDFWGSRYEELRRQSV